MSTAIMNNSLDAIAQELSYANSRQALQDTLHIEILARLTAYRSETAAFKEKYGLAFSEFKRQYEEGKEDFGKYDDLMAWEFAEAGEKYWQDKLSELKNAL